jgi:hypothetical protein
MSLPWLLGGLMAYGSGIVSMAATNKSKQTKTEDNLRFKGPSNGKKRFHPNQPLTTLRALHVQEV